MTAKAPGCYGIPSIFSFKSRVCSECLHFEGCKEASRGALKQLPDSPGVRLALSRFVTSNDEVQTKCVRKAPSGEGRLPKRIPLNEDQIAVIARLPKKAGEYLRTIFSRGDDLKILKAAQKGENPFCEDKARPYHLAFSRLIEGGFTMRFLRISLIECFGWTRSSAASQASVIWDVFQALGIAHQRGCALVPSPNVCCNNNVIHYERCNRD